MLEERQAILRSLQNRRRRCHFCINPSEDVQAAIAERPAAPVPSYVHAGKLGPLVRERVKGHHRLERRPNAWVVIYTARADNQTRMRRHDRTVDSGRRKLGR